MASSRTVKYPLIASCLLAAASRLLLAEEPVPAGPPQQAEQTGIEEPVEQLNFKDAAKQTLQRYNEQQEKRGSEVEALKVTERMRAPDLNQIMQFNSMQSMNEDDEEAEELTEEDIKEMEKRRNWLVDGVQKLSGTKSLTDKEREDLADPTKPKTLLDFVVAQQEDEKKESEAKEKRQKSQETKQGPELNPSDAIGQKQTGQAASIDPQQGKQGTGIDHFAEKTEGVGNSPSFGQAVADLRSGGANTGKANPFLGQLGQSGGGNASVALGAPAPTGGGGGGYSGNAFAQSIGSSSNMESGFSNPQDNPFAAAISQSLSYNSVPESGGFNDRPTPQPNAFQQAQQPLQVIAPDSNRQNAFVEEPKQRESKAQERIRDNERYFPQADLF